MRLRSSSRTQTGPLAAIDLSKRVLKISGPDLCALGKSLGGSYVDRIKAGLERSNQLYCKAKPISLDEKKWRRLAACTKAGVDKCCPAAAPFFAGISDSIGSDVYMALLDFEVYMIELQREIDIKNAAKQALVQRTKDLEAAREAGDRKALARAQQALLLASMEAATSSSESDSDSSDGSDEAEGDASTSEGQSDDLEGKSSTDKDLPSGRCTGFGQVDSNGAFVAQTVELPLTVYAYGDHDMVLQLHATGIGSVCVYDCDGRLCPIGMNSAGLAVTVFNLHQGLSSVSASKSDAAGGDQVSALSTQCLAWELLLGQYTLPRAITFLQQLPCRPMSGSAFMLADSSGVVTVELSPQGIEISDVFTAKPLFRANHPFLSATEAYYADRAKSDAASRKRLSALQSAFEELADEGKSPATGLQVLDLLTGSKVVCNAGSIATVCCDMTRQELLVEYKERVALTPEYKAQAISKYKGSKAATQLALSQGLMQVKVGDDGPAKRLQDGKTALHVAQRVRYTYALHESGGQSSGEQAEEMDAPGR
uniref:Uncharacterized protein n=1 Tax=Eutreptiella gymnastica TaxID=73025 RepID=A0A7S1NEP8_9EUGL|mmetsp:Transcript_24277/g.43844  ORF Transcript_24277/g.43844 Transcript_24277/m.43844 type:complete len:539 (+) Transcript_24277:91-1707(+)